VPKLAVKVCGLAAASVVVLLLAGGPAGAQEPASRAGAISVWTYSLYKTITYELWANLADIVLYAHFTGVPPAATGLFTVVNVTTAAGAYYVHEVLWNLYGPPMQESAGTALEVGMEKVILYRVVSTARNLALLYVFTGSVSMSVCFAVASNVVDAILFAANEYAWYAWGPPIESVRMAAATSPPQVQPAADLHPGSTIITEAAAHLRRGAASVTTAARAAADGIAGARLSRP